MVKQLLISSSILLYLDNNKQDCHFPHSYTHTHTLICTVYNISTCSFQKFGSISVKIDLLRDRSAKQSERIQWK